MELLRIFGMNFKKLMRNKRLAFTLAEVVVVMAILGIMMAAFAPVVTKRTLSAGGNNKITFDVMSDHAGVYFGTTGDQKSVVIGDNEIDNTLANDPKLLIMGSKYNNGTEDLITPQISFGTYDGTTQNYPAALFVTPDIDLTPAQVWDKKFGDIILSSNLDTGSTYDTAYPYNVNKYNNTIIGANAISLVDRNVSNVTAIGKNACFSNTGSNVICLGADSGYRIGITEGGPGTVNWGESNLIFIGNAGIDYDLDKIYFGSKKLMTKLDARYALAAGGVPSDIRLKNVGKEFTGGIDELNQLTFYNFTYKRDADKTPRVGVMAQDLQKVFPDAVSQNDDGYLYIRKDDMFYAALNAIKDLFKKMTDNSEKIKALEERNAVLETQVKELQELYIDLAKKVDKKAAKKKLTITPEKPAEVETEPVPAENTEQPVQE